ncbi:MAG: hypothetical protein R2776_01005 [Flavobacteriaceae bacterium]
MLVSCASYPKQKSLKEIETTNKQIRNLYFSDSEKDYVYKASIDLYGNHFGGMLIIKKIAPKNHRVVFTTEMGSKIFDLSFIGDNFKVNFIISDLDRKMLLNQLKKDFRILFTEEAKVLKTFNTENETIFEVQLLKDEYYYVTNSNNLTKIVRVSKGKEKEVFSFVECKENDALELEIQHKTFDLTIRLVAI